MEWGQFISLGAYLTTVCGFFYYLSEKSADKVEKTVKEWRDEHRAQMEKSETHWREMFRYMTDRLDKIAEKK